MQKLRQLVKGEQMVRRQRMAHFHSADFDMDNAGPLFPSSWTPSFEIEQQGEKQMETLHPRTDFMVEAGILREALQAASPVFDKRTEDGMGFRIYKLGSLQVRTTEEHNKEETVGMVFSTRASKQKEDGSQLQRSVRDHAQIVKATEYVEPTGGGARFTSYVVLETEEGHSIVIEKAAAGVVLWAENPSNLDDRNALAKVIRSKDCRGSGATVGAVKSCHAQELLKGSSGTRFVQAVYCHSTGEAKRFGCRSGFRRPASTHQQQLRLSPASRVPRGRFTD